MRWLEHLEEALIGLLMVAMTVVAFGQVVARYVFNYSFVWALEITGVLFAWLIFLGMSYGVRVGTHIGVDVLVRAVGPRTARVLGAIAALLCIVYSLVLAWGGLQYVLKMHDVGILMQDVPVPQWIPRIVLPLGFVLLALRFGQALWRVVTGRQHHLVGDESADALKLRQDRPLESVLE